MTQKEDLGDPSPGETKAGGVFYCTSQSAPDSLTWEKDSGHWMGPALSLMSSFLLTPFFLQSSLWSQKGEIPCPH